jgi:DNA-binding LacI/PurR family transcriptional regulator
MATMRDVARLAGVSKATVSFVVNESKPVLPETRARVEAAMVELDFRRNVLARALASRRTRIIALMYPAADHRLGISALRIITSAATTASERGYSLVLWTLSNDDASQVRELLRGGLVDGVVLMEVQLEDARVAELSESNIPFALIGRTDNSSTIPFVDIDFEQTVRDSLDYLTSLGHTKIALVMADLEGTHLEGYGSFVRTEEAFRTQTAERQIASTVVSAPASISGGQAAVDLVFSELADATAIIVANEDAAPALVSELIRQGKRVPDDVSVLSILTTPELTAISHPRLSAMNIPQDQVGRLGVTALVDQLDGVTPSISQTLITCVLEVNGTTALAASESPRS